MTLTKFARIALVAALCGAPMLARPALADDGASMPEDLAGDWTGVGKAQRRIDGPLEPIKCKISSSLEKEGLQLGQTGRCATTDQTSSISGVIRFDPASGRYTGTWQTTADGKIADLSGNGAGGGIVFEARERGSDATGRIELVPQGEDRYVMRVTSTGGQGRVATSEITFSRR